MPKVTKKKVKIDQMDRVQVSSLLKKLNLIVIMRVNENSIEKSKKLTFSRAIKHQVLCSGNAAENFSSFFVYTKKNL